MKEQHVVRYSIIVALLLAGTVWMFTAASGRTQELSFPNSDLIATSDWILAHRDDSNILVVDVRAGKQEELTFIAGAVRLPWTLFRHNAGASGVGEVFVGTERAQEILGNHGVSRTDTVVLYDSVKEDGGATASYVFWVLDLLGHPKMKILDRGIDGWLDGGGEKTDTPRTPEPILYQAEPEKIRLRIWKNGDFLLPRLGDPHYQILDVRSKEEYLGEKPNTGMDGNILKLGHIPTSFNIDYRLNWQDPETKAIQSYASLLSTYGGLDPHKAVVVYCHSGRRSSFTYFILRAMGFVDPILYERSWNEWGKASFFFPVETRQNNPPDKKTPRSSTDGMLQTSRRNADTTASPANDLEPMKGGYISCGG